MLYSLVLIDDEEWILSGIRSAIDWEMLGFQVAGAFSNGKEAYEYLSRYPADAILTDIKMPIQDGISLIRELRMVENQDFEVVFLSGYDDFSLAQSSLRLGAVDYILKPSAPEQIEEVFAGIKSRLDKKKRRRAEEQAAEELARAGTKVLKDVVCNSISSGNDARYENFMKLYAELMGQEKGAGYLVSTYAVESTVKEQAPTEAAMAAMEFIRGELLDFQGSHEECYVINNRYSYSLMYPGREADQAEVFYARLCREARKRTGQRIVKASSREYLDFRRMKEAYEDSLVRLYQFAVPQQVTDLYFQLGDDSVLRAAVEDRDQQIVLWCLKNWMLKIDRAEEQYQTRLARRMLYSLCICFLRCGLPKETVDQLYQAAEECDYLEIKELMISFVKAELLVENSTGNKNVNLCREVAKYISKNYTEDITLNSLAERFYISPNYLGTLFKKNMGISIKEYHTTVRLDQADLLIASKRFKLYQVAEMAGYPNYEYFRKIYCKYRGKNPSG